METKEPASSSSQAAAGKAGHRVEKERAQFKKLLISNPNYFGTLAGSTQAAVKAMSTNTSYEGLACLGFNPNLNTLEATVEIKRSFGYDGDLCHDGSNEYVRFFLDYGSGWQDVGLVSFNAHDIPDALDCAKHPEKPLFYVLTRDIDPLTDFCGDPILPKARAILSWNVQPTFGDPNYIPIWGDVLDAEIQIKPRQWNFVDLVDVLGKQVDKKLKLPPLFEEVKLKPIPLPDPPPFKLAELANLYSVKSGVTKAIEKAIELNTSVEPHRFGLNNLQSVLKSGALNPPTIAAKAAEWKAVGLNFQAALAALEDTSGDVSYEQLDCLGLDYNREWLGATFAIKRPFGYNGDLCANGSQEYIAFWADWDDTCQWTYLGTAKVEVHDFSQVPADGIHYTAIWPVNLDPYRMPCDQPKVARLRAVLSWNTPPSTTNPDDVPYWGNRLDSHVQIRPGETGVIAPKIAAIGGVGLAYIDTAFTGMTNPGAVFGFYSTPTDPYDNTRMCAFGGLVTIQAAPVNGYKYRIWVQKDNGTSLQMLTDPVWVVDSGGNGSYHSPGIGGFFTYLDSSQNINSMVANAWVPGGDDLWDVRLELFTFGEAFLGSTPWYRIQMDNTAPSATITVDGGECDEYTPGVTITGEFVARDLHFGHFGLSTLPNTITTPSNQPVTATATNTETSLSGDTWSLNTASPINMRPCGYVIHLEVYDSTIVSSVPGSHNGNSYDAGFCLLKP